MFASTAKYRRQRGFTILEVIVAGMVLSIGLLATVSVANRSVTTSSDNQRRIEALNLARQGLEMVRNIRDTNWQIMDVQLQVAQANGVAAALYAADGTPPGGRSLTSGWDCFPTSAISAGATPFICDKNFTTTTNGGPNFALTPVILTDGRLADNVAYLTAQGLNSSTYTGVYRICPRWDGVATNYVSSPVAAVSGCTSGPTFYRRIRFTPITNPTTDKTQRIKVESSVTYDSNPHGDVSVEEYLTNWRKLN